MDDPEICEWSEIIKSECPHCTGDITSLLPRGGPDSEPESPRVTE